MRLRVDRLAETRPISASTRSTSSKLVGSTTLAITRSRNTSSPSASNPRSAYTPASTSYSRPDAVFSVRARGTTGRAPRCRLAAEQRRLSRGRDHRGPPGLRGDPEIENALPARSMT